MKRIGLQRFFVLAMTCHAALAQASPTSDDYLTCHKQAAWILQECLKAQPFDRDNCWSNARIAHDACYESVANNYRRRDDERMAAEKLKAEKRLKEKARQ